MGRPAVGIANRLHQTITRRGLVACELVEPKSDAEVVARLDDARALVAPQPASLDPYMRGAAARGLPVVAPLDATTAWMPEAALVPVPSHAGSADLAAALVAGIRAPRRSRPPEPPKPERRLLAALGLQ